MNTKSSSFQKDRKEAEEEERGQADEMKQGHEAKKPRRRRTARNHDKKAGEE